MILIGLTGKARVGKDTARRHLETKHQFIGMSFAWPIKLAGAATFGEPVEVWNADDTKDAEIPGFGITRRQWMQDFGEWSRQHWGLDFWIRISERSLEKVLESPARHDFRGVVFSDVRHDNEAEMIRSRGGEVWVIWNPRAKPVRAHVSERGVSTNLCDRGILNAEGFDQLYGRIDVLLDQHGAAT